MVMPGAAEKDTKSEGDGAEVRTLMLHRDYREAFTAAVSKRLSLGQAVS